MTSVKESLHGECENEISIFVYPIQVGVSSENADLSHRQDGLKFEVGRSYLLPLSVFNTPYLECMRYYFIANLAIDMENLSDSVMYGQKDVASHATGIDFKAATVDSLLAYVQEIIKDNPTVTFDPIAKDLRELVEISPDIFVVTVGKLDKTVVAMVEDYDDYTCTVTEILKTDNEKTPNEIEVRFFAGTVKEGDEVIVFVDGDMTKYFFASRRTYIESVQPIDKKDEIVSIIASKAQ